jgi:hypothetical protein
MAPSTARAPSVSRDSLRRQSSAIRTGCANERPSGSARGVPRKRYPYRDRFNRWSLSCYRQLTDLLLTLVGWAAPFSTRRVDFLSIKLGIRVCRDICGFSNRSSNPHDSLLAWLPSGLIITASPTSRSRATRAERVLSEIAIFQPLRDFL